MDRKSIQPHSEPGTASAEDGHVLLDGPGGIAITLTPDAATVTGERLVEAGRQARLQTPSGGDGQ